MLVPYNGQVTGMGDMAGWNPIKAVGRGIKKVGNVGAKIVTAPVNLAVKGGRATFKGSKALGRFIPKAASFGVKTAMAPITLSAKISKNIATTAARTIGGAAGTLAKTPLSAGAALAKGFAAPFKGGGGAQQEAEAFEVQRAEQQMPPAIPEMDYGPGYGGGGAGGYGGGPDVQLSSQGLTAGGGMSLNKKLLIGGGIVVGGALLWTMFGRKRKGPKS